MRWHRVGHERYQSFTDEFQDANLSQPPTTNDPIEIDSRDVEAAEHRPLNPDNLTSYYMRVHGDKLRAHGRPPD